MKEPIAARGTSTTAPREAAAPVRRAMEAAELRVVARYSRRMKPQRVYKLVVELQGAGTSAAAPVFVHPIIPGALVTPAELTLDPMVTGSKATFHITPLARGTLRGARLDIFHQGKLVQEIALGMRCVTQRLTWVLAVLTILVPAFLLYFTAYDPMVRVVARFHEVQKVQPGHPGAEKLNNPPKEQTNPLKEGEEDEEELQEDAQLAQRGKDQPLAKEDPQPKPKKSGRNQGPLPLDNVADPTPKVEVIIIHKKLFAGDALEWEIEQHMPDLPDRMSMPWQGEDDPPYEVRFKISKHIAWGVGQSYTYAHEMRRDHLSFWAGLLLLALTVISAVTHRRASKRQRGKPLTLTGGGLAPHGAGVR